MADDTDLTRQGPMPEDVPSKRSAALEPLGALVGTWFVKMKHVAVPDAVCGHKTYTWLEGGHFLIERSHFDHPDFPDSIAVIGADDADEGLSQHYFDSRGVSRIFRMSLSGGTWKVWRDAPGFSQRFTGQFSDDGETIELSGDVSKDGVNWQHDFTQTYSKGKGA